MVIHLIAIRVAFIIIPGHRSLRRRNETKYAGCVVQTFLQFCIFLI